MLSLRCMDKEPEEIDPSYDFTARDGSHKFRVKGVTHPERNEKTRTDVISLKANTTYDVKASVISGRGARSEKVEQGLLEKQVEEQQRIENSRKRTQFYYLFLEILLVP